MAENAQKYSNNKKKPGKTKAFFICLIIASFLWLAHALNTVYTYTFKIPVTFRNVPQNKKPLFPLPEVLTADVKASGLKISLILLSKPFRPLEIDFNTLKAGNRNQNYQLSSGGVDLQRVLKFETQLKHLSPDTLYFTEKTGYQKNVPVKVPLYIRCMEGYGYRKPVINPAFITILGDTSLISRIDTIYTQPLTLNNISKSISEQLTLIKPSQEIYTTNNDVRVHIDVARLIEHTLYVPVSDIAPHEGRKVNIYPRKVRVRFTAVQDAFMPEDSVLFKATINSARNRRSNRCLVSLSTVPGNVTVMDIDPREVEILILEK